MLFFKPIYYRNLYINDHNILMKTKPINKNILINLYFFVFSLLLTFLYLGKDNLGIYNFNWLFYGDASSDLINWLNFKNADWTFPIGNYKNGDLGENSIVFTGSIPILSIISKILFKNLDNFHFFSIWIFLCFYLQYLFSFLILKKFLKNDFSSLISALFFVLSPIFINRLGIHLSLGGHWILLAYFFIKLKNLENNKNIIMIICLSTMIHFYFTMMIFFAEILHGIFVKKFFMKKKIIKYFKFYLQVLFFTLSFMYILGYFSIPLEDTIGHGYGFYKLNILSFLDPSGYTINGNFNWSNFLPVLNLDSGEKEGFNYFGLGYLIMFLLYVGSSLYNRNHKLNFGYILIIFIILLFSLSNNIDFGQTNIFKINLNNFLEGSFSLARASGRFFWLVYYFLLFICLINVKKIFNSNYKFIIVILLCIQIIDLFPGYMNYFSSHSFNNEDIKIKSKSWDKIIDKDITFTSTYVKNQSSDFYKILPISIKNDFKSEIQYFARYNRKSLLDLRYKNYNNILNNNYELNKFYIINNLGHANHIKNILSFSETHDLVEIDDILILINNELSKDIFTTKEIIDKIKSKKINPNFIYKPKFKEGSYEKSFLGIGWTKHGKNLSAISDGEDSVLIFDLSELKENTYNLIINIEAIINSLNQNISIISYDKYGFEKKFILNDKIKKFELSIPISIDKIIDKHNYFINFNTTGQVSEFDVLKSPDKKKIGFKIISIYLE